LIKDEENIAVIHCNSGKGRAGLTTSASLFYLGLFDDPYYCI
jgi:protein-tyrosine phosphatase